jgi:hypothetical protein
VFIQVTKNKSVRKQDIIGIFDLDSSTVSNITRNFLNNAEKSNKTVGIETLPKSFILTDKNIYLSSHLAQYICKERY